MIIDQIGILWLKYVIPDLFKQYISNMRYSEYIIK